MLIEENRRPVAGWPFLWYAVKHKDTLKFDFLKIKGFWSSKDIIGKTKRHAIHWDMLYTERKYLHINIW